MRDHALDPASGIRRLVHFARLESVALRFQGLASGIHPLTLSLGVTSFEFIAMRSSSKQFFIAFDLHESLATLTTVALLPRRLGLIGGQVPSFETLTLFVNGRDFLTFTSPRVPKPGQKLVLWPPPR
jgi:hypothetical protein